MFLKDVTNVPTRSQTILSKLGIINQDLIVKHVHVVNQLEWGMHVWLSKGMKVEAFRNYLQFSIFHFCSIIESPGRGWLYSPIVCGDTMCVNPTENVTGTRGKKAKPALQEHIFGLFKEPDLSWKKIQITHWFVNCRRLLWQTSDVVQSQGEGFCHIIFQWTKMFCSRWT